MIATAVLLAACSSSPAQTEPTAPASSTSVAPTDTTTDDTVAAVAETATPTPPTEASTPVTDAVAPDAAALLAAGLERFAPGYHFVTTATIGGAVAVVAEGDRVGSGTRLAVTSGGSTIDYVVTPDGTWVFADGTWSELEETAPVNDPLGPLQTPLSVAVETFDAGSATVAASYPPAALSLPGDDPVEVIFTFTDAVLRSMTYVSTVNGVSAVVSADVGDLTDTSPVTLPEG